MRLSTFAFALALILAPATAWAGGLPSAFDPTVFVVALCDSPEAWETTCHQTVLEQSQANEEGTLWYFSAYAFREPAGPGGLFWYNFAMYQAIDGSLTDGVHRFAFRHANSTEPVFPGTYLEVYAEGGYPVQYGVFASNDPSTVTPEPATLALVGTGLAGIAALRRRHRARA